MAKETRIVIIGAGGQARDTAWLIAELARAGKAYAVAGFVVSDVSQLGPYDSPNQVLGDEAWLEENRAKFDALAMGIGTPGTRLRIATRLAGRFPDVDWPTLIHPSVLIDRETLSLGRGAMLTGGVVGSVNIAIGPFALVNLGCTLGHEAKMGAGSVMNHGASLSGGVSIGKGSLVGSRACVLQYRSVGDGATVGAGAVVTHDVPDGVTVVGVPARPLERAQRERIA